MIFSIALKDSVLEFQTKSSLIPQRWHFLTFSLNSLNLEITLNGIPDSSFKFPSTSLFSLIHKQINFEKRELLNQQSAASTTELLKNLGIITQLLEDNTNQSNSEKITKNEEKPETRRDKKIKIDGDYKISDHNSESEKIPLFLQISLGRSSIFESLAMEVDMLRVRDMFRSKEELRQLAAREGLPFVSERIEIGCLNCRFSEAVVSCRKGYHICTQQEIFGFAYQVSRINGWDRESREMWSYVRVTDQMINSDVRKLGVCCVNSDYQD